MPTVSLVPKAWKRCPLGLRIPVKAIKGVNCPPGCPRLYCWEISSQSVRSNWLFRYHVTSRIETFNGHKSLSWKHCKIYLRLQTEAIGHFYTWILTAKVYMHFQKLVQRIKCNRLNKPYSTALCQAWVLKILWLALRTAWLLSYMLELRDLWMKLKYVHLKKNYGFRFTGFISSMTNPKAVIKVRLSS